MKAGGYRLNDFDACNLPENVATAFTKVIGSMHGAQYKAVLYLGSQLVNGVNHLLLCEVTKATNPPVRSLEIVAINIPFDDPTGKRATTAPFEPHIIIEE